MVDAKGFFKQDAVLESVYHCSPEIKYFVAQNNYYSEGIVLSIFFLARWHMSDFILYEKSSCFELLPGHALWRKVKRLIFLFRQPQNIPVTT